MQLSHVPICWFGFTKLDYANSGTVYIMHCCNREEEAEVANWEENNVFVCQPPINLVFSKCRRYNGYPNPLMLYFRMCIKKCIQKTANGTLWKLCHVVSMSYMWLNLWYVINLYKFVVCFGLFINFVERNKKYRI